MSSFLKRLVQKNKLTIKSTILECIDNHGNSIQIHQAMFQKMKMKTWKNLVSSEDINDIKLEI